MNSIYQLLCSFYPLGSRFETIIIWAPCSYLSHSEPCNYPLKVSLPASLVLMWMNCKGSPKEPQKPLHSVTYLGPKQQQTYPQRNSDVWSVAKQHTCLVFILTFSKGCPPLLLRGAAGLPPMERHMQLLVLVEACWLAAFPIKLCNHINYLRLQVKLQMLHWWGKVHISSVMPQSVTRGLSLQSHLHVYNSRGWTKSSYSSANCKKPYSCFKGHRKRRESCFKIIT